MPLPPSVPKSSNDSLDLSLPVSDESLPAFHDCPSDWVYAACVEYPKGVPLDEKYRALSLAGKNPESFVMN